MSGSGTDDGVIRIGRKGLRKFAFGDAPAFEVDVVSTFHHWVSIDEEFRPREPSADGSRAVPLDKMAEWHQAAQGFVVHVGGGSTTVAEALDFIARLRECYEELASFFVPKSKQELDSPGTSEVVSTLLFSEEPVAG